MIRINYDTKEFPFVKCLEAQCNSNLDCLHSTNYREFDVKDSSFYLFYKRFAKTYIKQILQAKRIVVSLKPDIIISLPRRRTNTNFSHPITSNAYSIFLPFTQWYACNTINIPTWGDEESIKITGGYGEAIFLSSNDCVSGFQGYNTSNNTSVGMIVSAMAFKDYKDNPIKEHKSIGSYFNLL